MTDRIGRLADKALRAGKIHNFDPDKCSKILKNEEIPSFMRRESLCTQLFLSNSVQSITKDERLAGFVAKECAGKGDCLLGAGEACGCAVTIPPCCQALKDSLWIMGGNHMSANFEKVLRIGLRGYLGEIESSAQIHRSDFGKAELLEAMRAVVEGILEYAEQCARACRSEAEKESDAKRRAELLALSEICSRVPREPAGSFYEAVQAYWLIFTLFPDGLGRLDQYLWPFYKKDRESGKITREFALELIEELFIKVFSVLGPEITWSGNNHVVLAGYRRDGGDGSNDVTWLILQAIEELPTWRPQVTFRRTKYTTHEELRRVAAANRRRSDLIMLANDDVMVRGITEFLGIPYEDAVEYSLSGCSELVITGMSQMGSLEGHLNILCALEKTMNENARYETFNEFCAAYEAYLKSDVETILLLSEWLDTGRKRKLALTASVFTDGCIESGVRLSEGGAKYNGCTWIADGLINAADSLSVVRQFVYGEKRFSWAQLCRMLAADWVGFEDVRSDVLKRGHFFGNDDDAADGFPGRIIDSLNGFVRERTPVRGGKYTFGTLAGYELAHVRFGERTGATPDGRHRGEELCASISASAQRCRAGVTAYFKSAAKIDFRKMPNAVVVNVTFDESIGGSEERLDKLTCLLEAYFQLGGVHLQINYLSAGELKEAQRHPERYGGLRVRVTGFSGFFTTFDPDLQNELIRRAAYHE